MTQAGFFAAVYLVGLGFCLATGARRDPLLATALAFPAGLVMWVMGALVGLAVDLGPVVPFGAGGLTVVGLASWIVAVRREPIRSWRLIAALSVLSLLAAALVTQLSLAKFSPDSRQFVRMAAVLASGGGLDDTAAFFLADRGVFCFLSLAASGLTGGDLLYGLAPVQAISFAALFGVVTARGLAGEGVPTLVAWVVAVSVVVAVMSTYAISYHWVYIHANLGSSLYLFGFAGLYWLAERDGETGLLPAAFLCLIAFTLHRIEAPLFAAVFAVLATWPSRLPRRLLAAGLAVFGVLDAVWLVRLASAIPEGGDFLTPARAAALSGLCLVPIAGLPVVARLPHALVARLLAPVVLAGALAALALVFALAPEHMGRSVAALGANLLGVRLAVWGYLWWGALALSALALVTPPLRVGQPIFTGIAVALIVMVLMSFLRPPYREGMGDSASRMCIHFAPLLFFFLALKLVPPGARPAARMAAGGPEAAG